MKRPHSFVLVTFLLCYAVLSLQPLEAQPANGQITGLVTDEATGFPLSGINVTVLDTSGNLITSNFTDNNGMYVNEGLPAGIYFVSVFNSTGFINEVYHLPENRLCTGFCSSTEVLQGTPLEVPAGGGVTSGIDFSLLTSGMITGRITGITGGSPLRGIQVEIRDPSGNVVASAFTNGEGNYAARGGLPTGMYFASTFNVIGFVDEVYTTNPDALLCSGFCSAPEVIQGGTRIQVTASEATAGIDFALERSGVISGRVIEADTENPLANGNVVILDTEGNIVTVGFTDNTGRYSTQGGLPAGTYFVSTDNFPGFRNEVYAGVPCVNSCAEEVRQRRGTQIRISTGQQIANINFALRRGSSNLPPIANAGADQPVLSGAEVTLNGQASRDPEGQSLTYQWEQTDGPPVTLSPNPTVVNPTFQAPAEPGVRLTFSLVVNDGTTASNPDTVTIVVVATCSANGDVDGDEIVTPNDVVLAWQYFLRPTTFPLNECQRVRADVHPSQGITPADARCILQRFLGLPSCLP